MTRTTFHLVICTDATGNIGTNNTLLYSVPIDMQRFSTLTTPSKPNNYAVVMGSNTWCSLPCTQRPLKERINIVLTRNTNHAREIRQSGAYPFVCMRDVLVFIATLNVDKVFVIGGVSVYENTSLLKRVHYIHHTRIHDDASTHFNTPLVKVNLASWGKVQALEEWSATIPCCYSDERFSNDSTKRVSFRTLQRISTESTFFLEPSKKEDASTQYVTNNSEKQYLAMLRELLDAPRRATRNSATLSSFGKRIVVDLSDGRVPLLTSKKMAWKTIIRELLWFVRGETNNVTLQNQNVHIWDANGSRAFLDSRGLTDRAENDLGPVYGFQWRHFGAQYQDCNQSYNGQGIDQLEACREDIVNHPESRRMIFTAWNPSDLPKMALPPCHLLGQWYVNDQNQLWLQVYQRSGDMFLGVPFNLFSYSVLVHMMAHLTNTHIGGLVYILGDAHIYENHIDVVREQLSRPTHILPKFRVKKDGGVNTWEDFTRESFELENYVCEGPLKAKMVA